MPYTPYTPTWNNPYLAQNPYQPVMPSQTAQPYQQPVNGVEKVSGKDSLWQLPMPPNSISKPYFDYNGKVFYIVNTDAAGAKTIETFDFWPHEDEPVRIDGAQFVSRKEFDEFAAEVNAVIGATNGIHGPVQQTSAGNASQGADGTASLDAPRGLVGIDGKPHAD